MNETSERWAVWCEHADGRRYWLGDSTQTRWLRADAERIVAYLQKNTAATWGDETYEARPLPKLPPLPHDDLSLVGFRRALVSYGLLAEVDQHELLRVAEALKDRLATARTKAIEDVAAWLSSPLAAGMFGEDPLELRRLANVIAGRVWETDLKNEETRS